MEAWAWPSDWGLASFDSHCLQLLTYAKFSGAPLVVHESGNPFWTPKGNLPVFRHNNLQLASFHQVVSHLRTMNYSADYNLTAKQQSEVLAFTQFMEEKLAPAISFVFWLDRENREKLIRPWFAKQIPFPLNLYYIGTYQKQAANVIESRFNIPFNEADPDNVAMLQTAVYKSAEDCLNMLSHRLGDDPYLFGQAPSSADAVLYGYLAPLLNALWPNPSLKNYLKSCENLVKFVNRISVAYFPKFAIDFEKKTAEKTKKATEAMSHPDAIEPLDKSRVAIAGCVAASVMSAYVYHKRAVFTEYLDTSSGRSGEIDDDEDEEDQYLKY